MKHPYRDRAYQAALTYVLCVAAVVVAYAFMEDILAGLKANRSHLIVATPAAHPAITRAGNAHR